MYQQHYFVDKRTGTLADVCVAFGLAIILDEILRRSLNSQAMHTIRLVDKGSVYKIELSESIREDWINNCTFFALIPYITTSKKKAKKPPGIFDIDYDAEKQRNVDFRELQKTLRGSLQQQSTLQEQKPDPRWPIWAIINQMSAVDTYNKAVTFWYSNADAKSFSRMLQLILKMHATTPNEIQTAENDWKRLTKEGVLRDSELKLSLLQVWNPNTGKGQNTPKANRLDMTNIDSFWLSEYLKIVGFYSCSVPRFVLGSQSGGSTPKDRKTFALAPVNITLSAHRTIFDQFRDTLRSNSSIKLDILASLHYTDCFLQHCEIGVMESDFAAQLFGSAPENFVAGLHAVFYKDLGNAMAVMNLSFINLPHWMRVQNKKDIDHYREIIQEHIKMISGLRQKKEDYASEGGEEYTLLTHYRDFLSAHEVTAFFEFTAVYASYLMSAIERDKRWVSCLKQSNLEVLFMNSEPKLKPIIENEGFREIARAIRQSTVSLQYMAKRSPNKKIPYNVRYGLGQELKRRANYVNELIVALSDFLQSFNAENARAAEVAPDAHWRRNVREDAITEIIRLIDEYGAPVVAYLLLAFGYASASKEDESLDETTINDPQTINSQPT